MKSETYPLAVPPDLLICDSIREHSVVDGRKKRKKTKKESRLDKSLDERSFPRMRPISELAKEALELPPPQRLTLARILLDLSDEAPDFSPDAEAAWEQEICRRMEEVKAGRAGSSEFKDVFERLELTDGIRRIEDVATGRVPGLTEEEYRAGLSC